MTEQEKIDELLNILEEIKGQLDSECCQTLMDADSISTKIERIIKKITSN